MLFLGDKQWIYFDLIEFSASCMFSLCENMGLKYVRTQNLIRTKPLLDYTQSVGYCVRLFVVPPKHSCEDCVAGLLSYSSLCQIFPWRFLILALLQSWSTKSGGVFYHPPFTISTT